MAIALSRKGFEIQSLVSRKKESDKKIIKFIEPEPDILSGEDLSEISSGIILITTQDAEIENTAKDLAANLHNKPVIFHMSGSLSSEILKDLRDIGCRIGSIHPLVSISDPILGANRFENVYFCVEGDAEAVEIAKEIVGALGGMPFFIETKYKALYHASAVTSSGHLTALVDIAVEMLTKCGLSESQAQKILFPLIKSTVENLAGQTTVEALTGTFSRADADTFKKHIKILRESVSNEATEVYLQLGERSVHLAEEQGVDEKKIERLRNEISLAKKNFKC